MGGGGGGRDRREGGIGGGGGINTRSCNFKHCERKGVELGIHITFLTVSCVIVFPNADFVWWNVKLKIDCCWCIVGWEVPCLRH